MIHNRSLNHFPLENPTTTAPTPETRPAEFIGSKLVAKKGQKLSDVPGYIKPTPYERPKFIFCVSMTGPATIV